MRIAMDNQAVDAGVAERPWRRRGLAALGELEVRIVAAIASDDAAMAAAGELIDGECFAALPLAEEIRRRLCDGWASGVARCPLSAVGADHADRDVFWPDCDVIVEWLRLHVAQ